MTANPATTIAVERIERLKPGDLHDLCDAAQRAIRESGGFGWLEAPTRDPVSYTHLTLPTIYSV